MDCSKVQQELPAMIYGELSEEEARVITAHLDACENCRQARREMEEAITFLDQCPDDAFDATLSASRVPAIPRSMPILSQRETPWYLHPLPMAAAACLLAVLCLGLFGFKVEKTASGFAVSIGRHEIPATQPPLDRDPAIREVVQTEVNAGMSEFFVAMVKHLEDVNKAQQEEQERMARAFRLMHEEDIRRTRDMVHRVAQETEARAENTQRLFNELVKTYKSDSAETESKEIH